MTDTFSNCDWFVLKADGRVQAAPQVDELARARAELELAEIRRSASHAGAVLAGVFRAHPWLSSFGLALEVEDVPRERGGYTKGVVPYVEDVVAIVGVPIPDALRDWSVTEEGAIDPDAVARLLEPELAPHALTLFAAFADRNEFDYVNVQLHRGAVWNLLEQDDISGADAFLALCPEYAHRVAQDGDADAHSSRQAMRS